MSWNPKDHKDKAKPQHEFDNREVPAGTYIVGATWIDRPSGKNFVKLKFEVLHGPMKGAGFFTIMPTNVKEKQGSANRVYHFMMGMGREDIEINFEKTGSIAKAFLGAGVKVKVKTSKRRVGDKVYTDHDISKFGTRAQCSQEEREAIVAWNEAQASKNFGQDDQDDFNDDDFGGGGDAFDDDFGDDEIPF